MISSADFKCSSSAIIQKTKLNIIKKTINTILATIFNQASRHLSNILEHNPGQNPRQTFETNAIITTPSAQALCTKVVGTFIS